MSLRLPMRRLARPAAALSPPHPPRRFFQRASRLQAPKKPQIDTRNNPFLQEYLSKRSPSVTKPAMTPPEQGDLAPTSPFNEPQVLENIDRTRRKVDGKSKAGQPRIRNKNALGAALDPNPKARIRFERRMVIREVQKRGRLTKTQTLKQTERENLSKSPFIKTSTKKLTMLARQIAGKPIEEAIVQMRFSKKKAAQSVKEHLEYARDQAIVARGMGFPAADEKEQVIEMKDGKKKAVRRSGIYIDQAWVGRGEYGIAIAAKARGNREALMLPKTSISVLLKEEATRIRLSEERQKKRDNRKVWVHLPDRPIQNQSQYNLW